MCHQSRRAGKNYLLWVHRPADDDEDNYARAAGPSGITILHTTQTGKPSITT